MLKTTGTGQMLSKTFKNWQAIELRSLFSHCGNVYLFLKVRREGSRMKGVLLVGLSISIIHVTPSCAELALSKTGQVVKFIWRDMIGYNLHRAIFAWIKFCKCQLWNISCGLIFANS